MATGAMLEEGLKHQIARQWFKKFSVPQMIGKIDFAIADAKRAEHYYLWAESKRGNAEDIYASLVQLILTIGKERTIDKKQPPAYIGAFDEEKIAFVPYYEIAEVFSMNNFNWNVAPSNHSTPEFTFLYKKIHELLQKTITIFNFKDDKKELRNFIDSEFILSKSSTQQTKIEIDKNNFIFVYQKWRETVLPTLSIKDWPQANKLGIIDADFYLADLMSDDKNISIKDALRVVLQTNSYVIDKAVWLYSLPGMQSLGQQVVFSDGQRQHASFWKKYKRPPKDEFQQYILDRRDLLVPQDIRERKGSFFTPRQWVALSQESIAEALGGDWQDECYIWDCAAGTGNLLANLANPARIFASTLDKADVAIMKDIAKNGGLSLLEDNIFQFDFLNDDLDGPQVPQALKSVLKSEEKRAKLVVYINPPYAEAANARTKKGSGENRKGVASHMTAERYGDILGPARNELFAQFLCRIQEEVKPGAIGEFTKLKILQAPNFEKFRSRFVYSLKSLFVVPANTFDNVKGEFPIGFFMWKRGREYQWKNFSIEADVYDKNAINIQKKNIYCYDGKQLLMDWHRKFYDKDAKQTTLAWLRMLGSDVQNNNGVYITMFPTDNDIKQKKLSRITPRNLHEVAVYFAIRKVIAQTWLNDREQYLTPITDKDVELWRKDAEFKSDCLVYTLFHVRDTNDPDNGNHWIPFKESDIGARTSLKSDFMLRYITGKLKMQSSSLLASTDRMEIPDKEISFSAEAKAVLAAGRDVWRLYHEKAYGKPGYDVNAALLDVGAFFKGRSASGKINARSADSDYNALAETLSASLKTLSRRIEPKIYEYGFMLR